MMFSSFNALDDAIAPSASILTILKETLWAMGEALWLVDDDP